MADTITIRTSTERDVVKIVERGPQGPAGTAGTGLDTLTVKGDTLYRGETTGERLPIGSAGQILKVSSSGLPEWGAAPATGVTSVALASSDLTITGSPITASGTITANLSNSGATAGTYTKVTVDAKGRVTAGATATASDVGAAAAVNPSISGTLNVVDGIISSSQFGMTINAEENVITFSSVPTLNGATILREGDLGNQLVLNAPGSNAGAFTGGTGGSVDVRGGNALSPGGNGGNAGSINLRGGDAANDQGGSGESGGSINLSGSNAGAGGSINLSSGGNGNGGSINMYSGGGSINTSVGGGSIDTRGTGSIELGIAGTRTTLTGTATADRAISFPDAAGTLALTSDITKTAVGLGNVSNNAQVTSVSGTAPIVSSGGTTPTISVTTGTTAGTVAAGDHTHSQLHDRSHAITSTSDHTATANRVFYSNNSGQVTELALGAANTVLTSNGATSAPTFSALPSGGSKTYFRATALDNQPPSTGFATLDTRNSIAVLDFDDATTESAVFVGVMPEGASLGSGLIVYLHFMATTATSGNVRWSVAFERSNTDLDADSFDTATAATVATNGTSGIVTVGSITCTTIDSVAAGDLFRFRVQRLGADAADTMSGDAELVAVEVRSAA